MHSQILHRLLYFVIISLLHSDIIHAKSAPSSMFFVTDFDGTLAHYSAKSYNDDKEALVSLPASSGSGKVATVSRCTLELLQDLTTSNGVAGAICCSGMRTSTMLQRESFFPSIRWWVVENGGRIFERNGESLQEIQEWRKERWTAEGLSDLKKLSLELSEEGWDVDSEAQGYYSMIRIKKRNAVEEGAEDMNDVSTLLPRIAQYPSLSYTYNLGYLDVQIAGLGKLPATRYIISKLASSTTSTSSSSSYSSITSSTSSMATSSMECPDGEKLTAGQGFLFMGDDDNDVQIAQAANVALIANPHSKAMEEWLTSPETLPSIVNLDDSIEPVTQNMKILFREKNDIRNRLRMGRGQIIMKAPDSCTDHKATEFLLSFAKEIISN